MCSYYIYLHYYIIYLFISVVLVATYIQIHYPIITARPNDSALARPNCLQAVLALYIVNPSIQNVPHYTAEISYTSTLPA